ncbi:TetR/AcrR family transcriptional regulator C-terminal ligand-binding domain-containing protein [Streptomyces gardneri]|uniref:TetR-like C-terminal domain-containing protein n=1 Tax=Nocardia sputi TaxID=2943705 RepID=UPI001893927D|nr:TetR-like C-terminal domain-containing protein [Nocardia sputi]MBF6163859.1 TetR/AcrR family transcriptional regulator C-terminal ligand-binding domain-containing protein [Streptomyces gardneri]MBF6203435.1 TetR/AcrR family transcriptional regulator C-terminal ligand-binding domain-containing protein [Streptomyces gardneri]
MSDSPAQIRGARLQKAVLDATLARIESAGIGNVRVADVAADAGVHETSIYRRWKTLPRLLLDALLSRVAEEIPLPDTGSLRVDLERFMTDLIRFARTPSGQALIRGTVIAESDPEVDAARREFWVRRLSASEEIVRRGITRGDVAATVDPRLTMLTLGGLVHLHVTQLGAELPPGLARDAVDLVLGGITPR